MELTPLRYFVAIARAGHITRAAISLGVTQPALSASIQRLESEVGAPLLHRTGKGVELTDAGRAFLTHAEEALRASDTATRAVREVMGLERGSIRIGGGATAVAYLLPPVVSALRKSHPGLRFFVREGGSTDVAKAVLSGELDLGIVTLPVAIPDADGLVRVPLVEDELRLIVPPGHRLAPKLSRPTTPRKRNVPAGEFRWNDLAGEPFVAFEAGTAVRAVVDRAASAAGVTLNVIMELRSIESIKSMVDAGIGIALVSRFALDNHAGFGCRDGRLSRSLALIRRRDRARSPAAEAFEKELLARVGKSARPQGAPRDSRGRLH
ncbi:MAG: LysR family transcriptional regulator [Phycisphaeraceae bacterium]|nr:LysR family transcriptional regulator [Phycisphaeraceae bacterium]